MACMANERDLMSDLDRLDRLARDVAGAWSTDRGEPFSGEPTSETSEACRAARDAWIRSLQPSVRPLETSRMRAYCCSRL